MGSGAWLAAACCGSCGTENGDAAIGTFTNFAFSASMSATALLTASAVGPETLMCRWLAGSALAAAPGAWNTPFTIKTAPLLASMRSSVGLRVSDSRAACGHDTGSLMSTIVSVGAAATADSAATFEKAAALAAAMAPDTSCS